MQRLADVEALLRVDAVDENVSVDVDGVVGRHDGELVLPGRVHQVQLVILASDRHLLVEDCNGEKGGKKEK